MILCSGNVSWERGTKEDSVRIFDVTTEKQMVFIQKTVKQHTSHRNIVKGKRVECFLVNCSNENIAKGTRARAVPSSNSNNPLNENRTFANTRRGV